LPINILIQHRASLETLQLLAEAAPQALIMKDGRDEACSVSIALRLLGGKRCAASSNNSGKGEGFEEASIPETLLQVNLQAAQVHDRRRNYPLHVATYVGADFDFINSLYWAYPEALLQTNFYGETPLDIAIRNEKSDDRSVNFLQEKTNQLKTARLRQGTDTNEES